MKPNASECVRLYWRCVLRGPAERRAYHMACVAFWIREMEAGEMSDRLAKLQAERAALEAEIRAEKRLQNPPPWERKGRRLRRDRVRNPRSAARSGYVARATCTGYQLCAHLDCEH